MGAAGHRPRRTFLLPGQSSDYGMLVTVYPKYFAGGKYIKPPYLQICRSGF